MSYTHDSKKKKKILSFFFVLSEIRLIQDLPTDMSKNKGVEQKGDHSETNLNICQHQNIILNE